MKYRVKLDLSFNKESDARSLYNLASTLISKASSVNEGKADSKISYIDIHKCGHDENKPCEKVEHKELIKKRVVTIGRV